MLASVHHLKTSMRALRRAQAEIICRSRQTVKASSEILQLIPDLFEIFSQTQPHRTNQRRRKKLHWALLPRSLWSRPQTGHGKCAAISVSFSTRAQTLPEVHMVRSEVSHDNRSGKASVVKLCEKSKLHHKHSGAKYSTSDPLNVCLSLKEVLPRLQSNLDNISVPRSEQVQSLTREIQWRKLHGKLVPECLNPLDLDHLLSLQSQSSRRKFLNFLAKKEKLKHRQAEQRATRLKSKPVTNPGEESGLTMSSTYIRRGQSAAEDAAGAWNLARSLMFGPPIVFDLSYDDHMNRREVINTILQLSLVLKINKTLQDPFHVHLMNVAQDGHAERELKRVHSQHFNNLMVSITDKHPQHMFLNNQLVYLTADSPNILTNYAPSKVYIIGGFVDRSVKSRVSLSKAEEAGIAHARLPLDEHLQWHKSTKNLTLDQMMCILSELKVSGDWGRALQHVPSRKHLGCKVMP